MVDANSVAISSSSELNILGGVFNSATINVANDGVLTVDGGTLLTQQVTGSLQLLDGSFAPGQSIGTANILGDYSQSADSILKIEWGSNGADLLAVQNAGNLAGMVELSLLDGFIPEVGDSLEFLTAALISGMFDPAVILGDSVSGLAFALRQGGNSVFLDVVKPVPLPASVWLFLSSLGLLLIKRVPQSRLARAVAAEDTA